MVLESKVATILAFLYHHAISIGEFTAFAELAVVKHFLPFGSPQVVFQHLLVVLIMNDSTLEDHNLGLVPLTERLSVLRIGGNHIIE